MAVTGMGVAGCGTIVDKKESQIDRQLNELSVVRDGLIKAFALPAPLIQA
jgi:hypothetical protein